MTPRADLEEALDKCLRYEGGCKAGSGAHMAALAKLPDLVKQLLATSFAYTNAVEVALRAFIDTIDVTGGVTRNDQDEYAPLIDPDWLDLGLAYMRACEVLDNAPMVQSKNLTEGQHGC